ADIGARLHASLLHAAHDGDAHRDLAAPRHRDAAHGGARRGPAAVTHLLYVTAAYGASVIVLAALAGWIVIDQHGRKRELAELEARVIGRRSDRPVAPE